MRGWDDHATNDGVLLLGGWCRRRSKGPLLPAADEQDNHYWTPLGRALQVVADRRTLLILNELAAGPLRAKQLLARTPGLTPASLTRQLREMAARGLISRHARELRPRVEYELTVSGRELLGALEALSRWGMRRAWSAPSHDEHVRVDVLIGQLPLLLDAAQLPSGVLELVVEQTDGAARHLVSIDRGKLTVMRRDKHSVMPWACITGAEYEWIQALGSARAKDKLVISGDESLAHALLDALPLTE